MDATTLHTMRIAGHQGTETITWNGEVEDREAARVRFEAEMATGAYLAYAVVEAPETGEKRKEAIRDFQPEAEETYLVPRLVGG